MPSMLLLIRLRERSEGVEAPKDRGKVADADEESSVCVTHLDGFLTDAQATAMSLSRGYMLLCVMAVLIGVAFMVLVFAQTVYSIVFLTDYRANKHFFCDVVA